MASKDEDVHVKLSDRPKLPTDEYSDTIGGARSADTNTAFNIFPPSGMDLEEEEDISVVVLIGAGGVDDFSPSISETIQNRDNKTLYLIILYVAFTTVIMAIYMQREISPKSSILFEYWKFNYKEPLADLSVVSWFFGCSIGSSVLLSLVVRRCCPMGGVSNRHIKYHVVNARSKVALPCIIASTWIEFLTRMGISIAQGAPSHEMETDTKSDFDIKFLIMTQIISIMLLSFSLHYLDYNQYFVGSPTWIRLSILGNIYSSFAVAMLLGKWPSIPLALLDFISTSAGFIILLLISFPFFNFIKTFTFCHASERIQMGYHKNRVRLMFGVLLAMVFPRYISIFCRASVVIFNHSGDTVELTTKSFYIFNFVTVITYGTLGVFAFPFYMFWSENINYIRMNRTVERKRIPRTRHAAQSDLLGIIPPSIEEEGEEEDQLDDDASDIAVCNSAGNN